MNLYTDPIRRALGWRPRRQSTITALRITALLGGAIASAANAPAPFTAPPSVVWLAATLATFATGAAIVFTNQAVDEALVTPAPVNAVTEEDRADFHRRMGPPLPPDHPVPPTIEEGDVSRETI